MESLFLRYGRYLRDTYGETAYRVAVDAGFSCPNRGPDRSRRGCTYCDEYGSRAPYQERAWRGADGAGDPDARRRESIRLQVEGGLAFLRSRYGARIFLLYFQAFSGTYAPVETLRRTYDFALDLPPSLGLPPFRELIVSTRPDCIDREKADLLAAYRSDTREVWVELGLQSAFDETLERINRGHTFGYFTAAFGLLRDRNVKLAVHLIFGLPGEGLEAVLETTRRVAALRPEGIKIHNLHIPRGTAMLEEYGLGEITVPSSRRHLEYVIRALELLPPDTVIMRVTCDTPKERLILPRRFWDKGRFYSELRGEMRRRGTYQGRLWAARSEVLPRNGR